MAVRGLRGASGAGIAFFVLFVVGALFSMDAPDNDNLTSAQLDQKYLTTLAKGSNQAEHVIGAYLLILAAIAFIWFCLGLRARLEAATPDDTVAPRLLSGLAVFGATAIAAAGMASAVVAGAVGVGGEPLPSNGAAAHVVMDLTFPFLFVVFGLVTAAIIALLSVRTMQAGILPSWLGYTGWVAVLGAIGGVIFLPFALPLLWYLAVAIVGVGGATATARAAAPAAGAA